MLPAVFPSSMTTSIPAVSEQALIRSHIQTPKEIPGKENQSSPITSLRTREEHWGEGYFLTDAQILTIEPARVEQGETEFQAITTAPVREYKTSRRFPAAVAVHPEAVEERPRPVSIQAQMVRRSHFVEPILDYLRRIQSVVGSPDMEVYASKLLSTMRQMRDNCPNEPFVEVVLALYDALAFEGRWTEFSAEQYAAAHSILKRLAPRERLRDKEVEQAIFDLEDAGFDTTPFYLTEEEQSEEETKEE